MAVDIVRTPHKVGAMGLRTVIVQSAFWIPTVAISAALGHSAGFFAVDGFLYKFQTLVGAILTLGAAAIAVVPVWRQLERMTTQSNAALRDTFLVRLRETRRRKVQFARPLEALQSGLSLQIIGMLESESDDVSPHWAFEQSQQTHSVLQAVRVRRELWRDDYSIAAALDKLATKLSALYDCLDSIHRPKSMDRTDDDYSISEDEWSKIEANAVAARAALPTVSGEFDVAVNELASAFEAELNRLRGRLREVDDALMRGRI